MAKYLEMSAEVSVDLDAVFRRIIRDAIQVKEKEQESKEETEDERDKSNSG